MFFEGTEKSPVNEYWLFDHIFVLIKDPLPEDIDLAYVLREVESKVPSHLVYEVDSVYIGELTEFAEREINSFYRDGAIFITNQQIDNDDLMDDIIHEMAHAVESLHGLNIYMDRAIEEEFLGKRKRLYEILKNHDIIAKIGKRIVKQFLNVEYTEEFDTFLYKRIGYPLLTNLTMGLFVNPYAITSLREYFASGFEEFFMGDKKYIQKVSPQVYYKLIDLEDIKSEE